MTIILDNVPGNVSNTFLYLITLLIIVYLNSVAILKRRIPNTTKTRESRLQSVSGLFSVSTIVSGQYCTYSTILQPLK